VVFPTLVAGVVVTVVYVVRWAVTLIIPLVGSDDDVVMVVTVIIIG